MQQLLGENGLLRTRNTTVVMTTSSRKFVFPNKQQSKATGYSNAAASGDLCSVADSVFTITTEGKLQHLPEFGRDSDSRNKVQQPGSTQQDGEKEPKDASTSVKSTSEIATPPSPTHNTQTESVVDVRKGDHTLYAYYVNSVRKSLLALSLCFIATSSVADRLPGMVIFRWACTVAD